MTDKATITEAIRAAPQRAAEALLAAQIGLSGNPMTFEALQAAAGHLNRPVEDVAADEIERLGLLKAFTFALSARGVAVDGEIAEIKDALFDPDLLQNFLPRGQAFRCRIRINKVVCGSGCLVSPSLVLTAWHVIRYGAPYALDKNFPPIEVELSDGTKRHARSVYFSACTEAEWDGKLPGDDAQFAGFNDVALIKLEQSDGIRFGFAPLPPKPSQPRSGSSILLIHFPDGKDKGIGFGQVTRWPRVKSRWKHSVMAQPGSSGGPCFSTDLTLAGIHQGQWNPQWRLVPVDRFAADVQAEIQKDITPATLWSLDDTPQGTLVIGRDLFFEAIAAAAKPSTRVRGVRVKRLELTQGTAGLAFSFEILTQTLARNPGTHRTVRIGFETPFADLLDEIQRRTALTGIKISQTSAGAGARAGETTLEAAINERARLLCARLNAAAGASGHLLWFLFENPPAGLTDAERFAFEAFVGAALKLPNLRLVLTGFETISTPGEEFANAGVDDSDGAPGMIIEYFGLYNRGDVEQLLTRACRDFGVVVPALVLADRTDQILRGVSNTAGQYEVDSLKTVTERAIEHLDYLKSLPKA